MFTSVLFLLVSVPQCFCSSVFPSLSAQAGQFALSLWIRFPSASIACGSKSRRGNLVQINLVFSKVKL